MALPQDISARVRSASGDTCTADVSLLQGSLHLQSGSLEACHVSVQLDDGTTRTATVTFRSLDDCCGGYSATASPFDADGGRD